jgi:hypothetical protein
MEIWNSGSLPEGITPKTLISGHLSVQDLKDGRTLQKSIPIACHKGKLDRDDAAR